MDSGVTTEVVLSDGSFEAALVGETESLDMIVTHSVWEVVAIVTHTCINNYLSV